MNHDKVVAPLDRDSPDEPLLQLQWSSWSCGEWAALLLGHFPIPVEME
jgi:hypothetical protein